MLNFTAVTLRPTMILAFNTTAVCWDVCHTVCCHSPSWHGTFWEAHSTFLLSEGKLVSAAGAQNRASEAGYAVKSIHPQTWNTTVCLSECLRPESFLPVDTADFPSERCDPSSMQNWGWKRNSSFFGPPLLITFTCVLTGENPPWASIKPAGRSSPPPRCFPAPPSVSHHWV